MQISFLFLSLILLDLQLQSPARIFLENNPTNAESVQLLHQDSMSLILNWPQGNIFDEKKLEVAIVNPSESPVRGYVGFDKKYLVGKDWLLKTRKDSSLSEGYSNGLFLQLNGYDTAYLSFKIDEVDRLNDSKVHIVFLPEEKYLVKQNNIRESQAFFFGIFSFLAVFNFLLYFFTKWKVYAKYAAYILAALLYLGYYYGFLQEVFPFLRSVSINLISTLYSTIFVLYFWFLNDLGNYRVSVPKADLFLRVGIGYKLTQMFLEIPLILFKFNFLTHSAYKYSFLVLEVILISLIIYHILKARDLRGRVVIAGSTILVIAAILAQFDIGYDRGYILEFGILAELLLFSISLGYISRKYYEEKNETQQLYVEQLRKNNILLEDIERQLEEKVNERTKELNHRAKENDMLLQEVHHRVKNNLQMISSLLNMQIRRASTAKVKTMLNEANSRIAAIGLIHEHLYKQTDLLSINLKDYVKELIDLIAQGFTETTDFKYELEIPLGFVSLDQALPVGLTINELVTNSLKYAKPDKGQDLQICISIKNKATGVSIRYSDNGQHTTEHHSGDGLGFTLIKSLAERDENFQINKVNSHFEVNALIPEKEYDGG